MNESHFLDLISGRRRGVVAAMLRGALTLGIPAYGAAVRARNCLYDMGLRRIHDAGIPVVSVGNLTTGGTGKTPVVAWAAEWFRSHDVRPCLVSRGYRLLEAGGNDEQRVLAQLCPQVPHVQNRDRVAAARIAVRLHDADVVILDDGFQHRRLARDLDIVLIDTTNPWGYGHLLPRGLLRELPSALRRADLVVLTRV
ncbi:MAG: tetraacyldisaccharide 4'-kinase, partial [Planctomycetaceae bacterium]